MIGACPGAQGLPEAQAPPGRLTCFLGHSGSVQNHELGGPNLLFRVLQVCTFLRDVQTSCRSDMRLGCISRSKVQTKLARSKLPG